MANTALENILAQKLIEIMSQEQKDKIVSEYIQSSVFGNYFDGMVKEPARRCLADIINKEIEKQLLERHDEIENLVFEAFNETMKDNSLIQKWIKERFIKNTAKRILE